MLGVSLKVSEFGEPI